MEADGRHRVLIEDQIISFLAGPEAEKRFAGKYKRVGAGSDADGGPA
jgi:hypothetical protein